MASFLVWLLPVWPLVRAWLFLVWLLFLALLLPVWPLLQPHQKSSHVRKTGVTCHVTAEETTSETGDTRGAAATEKQPYLCNGLLFLALAEKQLSMCKTWRTRGGGFLFLFLFRTRVCHKHFPVRGARKTRRLSLYDQRYTVRAVEVERGGGRKESVQCFLACP